MRLWREIWNTSLYGKPIKCSICNGPLVYKGVGEYQCSECFNLEYDDYGKVRLYIESHNGATASEISEATEVSQAKIRQMLKEERLEVASDSRAFLHCEACGKEIRSGQFCSECEAKETKRGRFGEKVFKDGWRIWCSSGNRQRREEIPQTIRK